MKRILFVDDDNNILDGIRRMLHADRNRWDMQFAIGGEAALRACEAARFDVVISDMMMPGMDGATLLGHIRDRYPSTARLILSGYSEQRLATRAVAVAYRVLSKPCNGPELHATIERVCTLQDIFCTPEIRRIIGTIGELPSLSRTYTALDQAVHDPSASLAAAESYQSSECGGLFGNGYHSKSGSGFRYVQGFRSRRAHPKDILRKHAAGSSARSSHRSYSSAGQDSSGCDRHGRAAP